MRENIKINLIKSYQVDGGFIVHDCEMLRNIYNAYGVDPKISCDRRIFDIEGITHFFQIGVIDLAKKMNIGENDYVLNPGDGSGAPSRLLTKMFGCKVVGIDINPDQVNKARECALLHGVENNVEYFNQNVEDLDLDKKNFSKAFCNETSCHWEDKEKAFNNINKHLQKGALIGFNEWTKGNEGTLNDAYSLIPEFKNLYEKEIWFQESLDVYKILLESSGFKVIEMSDCTDKIDVRIKARVKASSYGWDEYKRVMGDHAVEIGLNYYRGILKTHYDFLKYAVIIAKKI